MTEDGKPIDQTSVFITGGTGFIGAYIIIELINRGYLVKALRRTTDLPSFISNSILDKVEWVEGDLFDVDSLDKATDQVDVVIHAAAMVSFKTKDKEQLFKTNVEGTANLVNIAVEKNIRRFIHISSVSAIGRTGNSEKVTESKEWVKTKRNSNYSISKHAAEMEVWRAIGEGLNAVILNPSTVLGYGDWNKTSCALFKTIYGHFSWYSNGTNGFVDVEDVARIVAEMIPSEIRQERFIVSAADWSYKKLFDTIADNFGIPKPSRKATPFLSAMAWRWEAIKSFFTGRSTMISKESARIAASEVSFDNRKILTAIPGFSFTPLEKTIVKACESYLKDKVN